MKLVLILALFVTMANGSPIGMNTKGPAFHIASLKSAADKVPLKQKLLGLEYYLRDKKDHEELCSEIPWEQPALDIYQQQPKSYLPKNCKQA
jgi:hypothetical protein